jgi:hypothetical protein
MNEATRWRTSLAQAVAIAYAADPQVAAVALGGSVARGWADRHSDIEIYVFWENPPSDSGRLDAVERAGGAVDIWWQTPPDPPAYRQIFDATGGRMGQVWPYEEDEWSEHFYVRGVDIGVSGFLCATVDQYLADVVGRFETTERKQLLLAAIVGGRALVGAAQFERWQTSTAAYPEALARAVVAEQLEADARWWDCEKVVQRDERALLYSLLGEMAGRITRILLALNRRYLPDPRLKWLDRLAASLPICPAGFAARLQQLYRLEPVAAVHEAQQLFDETLDLVERHLPGVETAFARKWYRHRRAQWDQAPPGLEGSAE